MTTTACARCSKQVPDAQLIPFRGKRICLECEMEVEETANMRKSVYRSIFSLPTAILLGWLTICIPFANFLLFPLAAIAQIVLAVQGIRLGMSINQAPEEFGVGTTEPILLIVFGALTGLSGLAACGMSLLMIVGLLATGFQ